MAATGSGGSSDIAIGRIGPPRGVRGDLFVQPWTDDPDARFAEGIVLRTDPAGAGPLTVDRSTTASGKLVVHFTGVDSREAAEALRGVQLVIEATERPSLDDPNEYYADELVGLTAVTVAGDTLGPIAEVVDIAGSDYLLLVVAGQDRLVPFVAAIVPNVDLARGIVEIDPPPGLFDL